MSKFIRDVLLFCGLNLLVWGYLFAIYDVKADYLAALNDSLDRLETTPPPRIIFIGGSSVAWSNHSQLVKDAFGMDVENFASHAGMSLSVRINETRQLPREGDVVVLSIEWANYSDEPRMRILSQVVMACPRMLTFMNSRDKKLAADGLLPAMRMPLSAFAEDFKANRLEAFTHASAQRHKRWRLRSRFNELGDFTGHYGVKPFGIEDKVVGYSTMEELEAGIKRLNDVYAELQKRNVRVFYFVPVIPESRYKTDREIVEAHVSKLVKQLKFPVLNPDEYVFQDNAYFDSCYHMQDEPGVERTQIIVDKLKPYMNVPNNE